MEFLKDKNGVDSSKSDPVKAYMINGGTWTPATLKHYNAGVSKLMTFATEHNIPRKLLLPINPEVLCQFTVWAGPDLSPNQSSETSTPIKANTIRTYLSGVKAWHLFHGFEYPHKETPRVEAILKAARKLELQSEPSRKKDPVLVSHLFELVGNLAGTTFEKQVTYTVALVAFWGMARLGELVKPSVKMDQVRVKDLVWDPEGNYIRIRIRAAKTAAVGEIQEIHCQYQPSLLDPVDAIRRLIKEKKATEDDPLFSYPREGKRVTLTKARCQKILAESWNCQKENRLTGHSFRVGGASLRWNLNSPLEEIVIVGRWKSKAYKLYIREYTDNELLDTLRLLEEIRISD